MQNRSDVPCNGCTRCCQNDLLVLHPECGDDPAQYETMEAINPLTGQPCLALKHKPKGGCIYLGRDGCMIHDRAPAICQEFDCRRFYMNFYAELSRKERRKLLKDGMISKGLLNAGKHRIKSLIEDYHV